MTRFSLLIMIVMEFSTQRELLEYLWKNWDDRHLVARMIARGDVYKEDGMYILNIQKKKKDLIDEVNELKERVKELENSEQVNSKNIKEAVTIIQNNDEIEKLKQELHEAKVNCNYYEKLAERRKEMVEWVIHETYVLAKAKLWNKMEEESDFRNAIVQKVKQKMWV